MLLLSYRVLMYQGYIRAALRLIRPWFCRFSCWRQKWCSCQSSGASPDGHSLSDISPWVQPHHPVGLWLLPCLNIPSFILSTGGEPWWLQTSRGGSWGSWNPPPHLLLLHLSFGFNFPFQTMLLLCFWYLPRVQSPAESRHSPRAALSSAPLPPGLAPAAFEAWGGTAVTPNPRFTASCSSGLFPR